MAVSAGSQDYGAGFAGLRCRFTWITVPVAGLRCRFAEFGAGLAGLRCLRRITAYSGDYGASPSSQDYGASSQDYSAGSQDYEVSVPVRRITVLARRITMASRIITRLESSPKRVIRWIPTGLGKASRGYLRSAVRSPGAFEGGPAPSRDVTLAASWLLAAAALPAIVDAVRACSRAACSSSRTSSGTGFRG